MILTTSDPVCTARDPASLEAEWSELARRRVRPSIFLTPEWLAVARAHDPREQLTLAIGSRGIAAIARDPDGTLTFAGGDLTDEQDVVAAPPDARFVAEALGAWIADQAIARAAFSYVPEETPTPEALARALTAGGFASESSKSTARTRRSSTRSRTKARSRSTTPRMTPPSPRCRSASSRTRTLCAARSRRASGPTICFAETSGTSTTSGPTTTV